MTLSQMPKPTKHTPNASTQTPNEFWTYNNGKVTFDTRHPKTINDDGTLFSLLSPVDDDMQGLYYRRRGRRIFTITNKARTIFTFDSHDDVCCLRMTFGLDGCRMHLSFLLHTTPLEERVVLYRRERGMTR